MYRRQSVPGTTNQKFWDPIHPDSGTNTTKYHDITHEGEEMCINGIQEVRGSIPLSSTKKNKGLALSG